MDLPDFLNRYPERLLWVGVREGASVECRGEWRPRPEGSWGPPPFKWSWSNAPFHSSGSGRYPARCHSNLLHTLVVYAGSDYFNVQEADCTLFESEFDPGCTPHIQLPLFI